MDHLAPTCPIATVVPDGPGDVDRLLERLAAVAAGRGLRVRGLVQVNRAGAPGHRCDMDVRVLPGGPEFRISQRLGAGARGCRLDPAALEAAVAAVSASLSGGADLLVVNKFGKHEAQGRGFRPVIAAAVEAGIPVIAGLNGLNAAAFADFVGDLVVPLPPHPDALLRWLDAIAAARAA
jgi:hypothetical protein